MNNSGSLPPAKIPAELADFMKTLSISDPNTIKYILAQSMRVDIEDLWEHPELARTYWVLMLNTIDNSEERKLSSELLNWKHLTIKDSARLSCVQTAERELFKFSCGRFQINECPVLIMSDSPLMEKYLKIDGELLIRLSKRKGNLLRFVNRLHIMVENGYSLEKMGGELNSEKFWRRVNLVYKEVKSLFSISLSAKTELGD